MAELLSKTFVILNVADGQDGKPGTDGVSGTSYYVHIRYSKYSDGTDFSTTVNQYVGIYSGTSKTAPTDKKEYQWSRIEGVDGTSVSIKETKVEYQKSSSGTTQPTGNWGTTIPIMSAGEYLWTRTTVIYSDNKSTVSYSCSYWGVNGINGINGTDGKDGTSIKISSTSVKYQSGTSGTTKPTGTWQTTIPTIAQGNYLWTQTIVTYSDGSKTETYSCARQGINGTDGKNGTSITIIETSVKYQSGKSGVDKPTGTWQTTVPSVAQGDFLWTQTIVNYSDGSKTESYSCSRQGSDGTNGKDGTSVTISNTSVKYQAGTSGTTPPTSTWSDAIPSVPQGQYLWTQTIVTYSNGKKTEAYSCSRQGSDGVNGKDGTSVSITSTEIKYQVGNSGTEKPTSTWVNDVPAVPQGKYLWTRTTVTYSDKKQTISYSCSYQGTNGINGTDGKDGKDGVSPTITSTVNEYQQSDSGAQVPTGTWTKTPPEAVAGKYIWTRTTVTYSDNKTSVSYSVSKNGVDGADGQSTYVDIRYSNDGAIFTDNNGLVPGDYIGVYVTTDSNVQLPTYVPQFESYTWKKITGDPDKTFYYKLSYNYSTIYKFLTTKSGLQNEQYVKYYSYTPSTLKATLQKIYPNLISTETDYPITAYYSYYDSSYTLQTDQFTETSIDGIIELDLTSEQFSTRDLQSISFIVKDDEGQILSDVINVTYGLTEDMAKFSLNATNIVQSILNTTLTFDSDGLTVKNGGFTIKDDNNQKVFYADDEGNLFFKGKINSSSGSLAGWVIEPNNIHDIDNKVGLYSGKEASYQLEKSPIRFWAGKDEDNFNFAVTDVGKIYATDILLKGTLQSQDATIANKLFVGTQDNGVVIYGGENSYISSARYASGQLGYGWRINQDGSAEFSNLIARGKIESSVFEYNKASSVGGSLYIAPTIYMGNNSELITQSPTSKKYLIKWITTYTDALDICGHSWTTNDFVKLNGEVLLTSTKETLSGIDATIESITKENGYVVFTFGINPVLVSQSLVGGYMASGGTIILYGTGTRKQGLYLTAADAGAPYIDVYDAEVNSSVMPAVRLGNLSGISDDNFPNGRLEGYGLYSSNAYLRGQLMLPGAGITNQNDITYGSGEAASPIRIWAGTNNNDITQSNFIVTANGYLYARQGVFEGTVKAINSEFSGTIRTAGVVIDENGEGDNPLPSTNHFFVAYKTAPTTFNDYVLDIGEHGLSIWEGALRAYSDFASGENSYTTPYTDNIYGYDSTKPTAMPLPYFTLVDNGTADELDARIVAHKGHFANIKEDGDVYSVNSAVLADGLWFGKNVFSEVSKEMENTSYYNVINQKVNGLYYNNNIITLKGFNVNLETKKAYFNYTANEILAAQANGLHIKGQVSINSDEGAENTITMGKQVIREHFENNVSIGFDFIVS